MNKVIHLSNITNHLTKLEGDAANLFRMYYAQKCKELLEESELPKSRFGPSVMCFNCGSLWSKNKSTMKLEPGRACSKSVKQIIRTSELNSVSRYRATLLKKSLKNQMNKFTIKCSVCSKKTIIKCKKPKRPKPPIQDANKSLDVSGNVSISQKKKKRKAKDKMAGLKIPNSQSPQVKKKKKESTHSTPVIKIKEKELTPLQKVRKLNLNKSCLSLNDSSKEKSGISISSFLEELY